MQGALRPKNMPLAHSYMPQASMQELKHLPPPDEFLMEACSTLATLGYHVEDIADVFNVSEDLVCNIMTSEVPMDEGRDYGRDYGRDHGRDYSRDRNYS